MKIPLGFKLKPEQNLQIQVHQWFVLQYPMHKQEFHHFANERKCSKLYGYFLGLMGVKPGVADIFIDVPSNGYRGLWMELKVDKNRPTSAQNQFLSRKREIGYATLCVVGFDAAKAFIEGYLV
jgi:hypothetical protein